MRLLFVHNAEKLKEDKKGNFYTDGSYSQKSWDRYLSICDELSVIFRKDSTIYDEIYAKKSFQFFDKEKIKFIKYVNITDSIVSYINIFKRLKNNKTIKKSVKMNDCVIARLPCDAGYKAIKYARRYKKPYMVEVVGCTWDVGCNLGVKGRILALKNLIKMKYSIKKAEYALYVTSQYLQNRYPCKGYILGCSDVVLESTDNSVLNRRLGKIKEGKFSEKIIIGTLGAVDVPYKGQKYIIEAISRLNRQGYNFEYHIAGNGDKTSLQRIAKKFNVEGKVKFLGSIPHNEIMFFLDEIDIYAQPSKTEGLPRALIEAMSRGCLAIGSNVGGIPELLNEKYMFRKGDVDGICHILKSIDKNLMEVEAKYNFIKVQEYTITVLDKKREIFYNSFAKSLKTK